MKKLSEEMVKVYNDIVSALEEDELLEYAEVDKKRFWVMGYLEAEINSKILEKADALWIFEDLLTTDLL